MSVLGQLAQIEFKNTWKYKIVFQKATHHVLYIDIYILLNGYKNSPN